MTSGISWLHDTLLQRAKDRLDFLKDGLAEGVPDVEYRQMVGRCQELKRLIKIDIPELFEDFYKSDADEESSDGELKEMPQ